MRRLQARLEVYDRTAASDCDVRFSAVRVEGRGDSTVGVFGGHTSFGDARRFWDFRSVGRGMIDFESVIVALNDIGYAGPLSVEWEDSRMDRVHGATESAAFCRRLDFEPAAGAFDAVFARENR